MYKRCVSPKLDAPRTRGPAVGSYCGSYFAIRVQSVDRPRTENKVEALTINSRDSSKECVKRIMLSIWFIIVIEDRFQV